MPHQDSLDAMMYCKNATDWFQRIPIKPEWRTNGGCVIEGTITIPPDEWNRLTDAYYVQKKMNLFEKIKPITIALDDSFSKMSISCKKATDALHDWIAEMTRSSMDSNPRLDISYDEIMNGVAENKGG